MAFQAPQSQPRQQQPPFPTPPHTAERHTLSRPRAGQAGPSAVPRLDRPPGHPVPSMPRSGRDGPVAQQDPPPKPRPDSPSERPRRYAAGHRPGPTDTRLAILAAALASAAAGIVHVAAVPSHWDEWPAAGMFFLFVAVFQLGWAILVLPFEHRVLTLSAVPVNLGLIGVWAFSRWQGVPVGPHAGAPEAIGLGDVLSTALEAGIVACLLWTLIPRESDGVLSARGYRLAGIVAAVMLGLTVIPGVFSALSHGSGGHGHGESEEGHHSEDEGGGDGHDHGEAESTEGEDDHSGHDHGGEESSEPAPEESSEAPAEEEDHTHAPGEEHG